MPAIRQLIDQQAACRPHATYAVAADTGRSVSYGELATICREVGRFLDSAGTQPGEHVSVVMPNGLGTLALLLGSLYAGRCVNPVNLLSQPEQMRYVLDHADARIVLVAPPWEARVRGLLGDLTRRIDVVAVDADRLEPPQVALAEADRPGPTPVAPAGAPAAGGEPMATGLSPEAPGLLMYTSGTTGRPKGVMLTQANLAASALAISAEHELGEGDRVLAVLPLYHINAFAVTMLAPLAHGGSLVMPSRFSATAFWDQAGNHQCTWINLVPTMISFLLEGESPSRELLRGLRFCRSASASLPPGHHRAFEQKFGIGVIETMGLTETAAPSFSNPLAADQRRVGSVGRPSGCEARVADAAGASLPDGATGEILVRGPQVMTGYYKDAGATRAAFHAHGWLRTGDLGHRDADGYFFVTGRIKELIIKGGENIAPREVDEALLGHPAVLDAAAVGIPDRHYGQEIMACVVLRPGAACLEEQLRDFCVRALGRYKTPSIIRFVAELPRGPSGKVQRLKLLDLLPPGPADAQAAAGQAPPPP